LAIFSISVALEKYIPLKKFPHNKISQKEKSLIPDQLLSYVLWWHHTNGTQTLLSYTMQKRQWSFI
jgi:hypothetical protein